MVNIFLNIVNDLIISPMNPSSITTTTPFSMRMPCSSHLGSDSPNWAMPHPRTSSLYLPYPLWTLTPVPVSSLWERHPHRVCVSAFVCWTTKTKPCTSPHVGSDSPHSPLSRVGCPLHPSQVLRPHSASCLPPALRGHLPCSLPHLMTLSLNCSGRRRAVLCIFHKIQTVMTIPTHAPEKLE